MVFQRSLALVDRPVTVSCGQCTGCRMRHARDWAVRCIHEAQMHRDNMFITLTYDEHHLPFGRTLVLEDYQKFMKRLRKKAGQGIRFFHCGEYGETTLRPHYHALLFGVDMPDKQLFRQKKGVSLYTSKLLEELWPFGFSTVGAVTYQSAAYTARYIMKKQTGDLSLKTGRYDMLDREGAVIINRETGAILQKRREYTTMSRRPGIGQAWLERFGQEVLDSDEVIIDGRPVRPPRYYDKILEEAHAERFDEIRRDRIEAARPHAWNNSTDRLVVREKVAEAKLSQYKRELDE